MWHDARMDKNSPRQILADNLVLLMERFGWKQPALAKKSGIGQSTISRLLKAQTDATLKTLGPLAKAFKLQPSDLTDSGLKARLSGEVVAPIQQPQPLADLSAPASFALADQDTYLLDAFLTLTREQRQQALSAAWKQSAGTGKEAEPLLFLDLPISPEKYFSEQDPDRKAELADKIIGYIERRRRPPEPRPGGQRKDDPPAANAK